MALWSSVAQAISAATGRAYAIRDLGPTTGGQVSHAYVISDGATPYFVKTQGGDRGHVRAFAWEARSLRDIRAAGVPTPAVIATGQHGTRSFMVLEYIVPAPPPSAATIAEALVTLHRTTAPALGADAPGWGGFEALDNTPSVQWAQFWCQRRFIARLSSRGAQPAWAAERARLEALLPAIGEGLAAHQPTPTLLHGDLQSPNWLGRPDGSVVFIDAAVWFGDPDVDLAALSLGPPAARAALDAYVGQNPRPAGFAWRLAVYRLWYLLLYNPPDVQSQLAEAIARVAQGAGE